MKVDGKILDKVLDKIKTIIAISVFDDFNKLSKIFIEIADNVIILTTCILKNWQ